MKKNIKVDFNDYILLENLYMLERNKYDKYCEKKLNELKKYLDDKLYHKLDFYNKDIIDEKMFLEFELKD